RRALRTVSLLAAGLFLPCAQAQSTVYKCVDDHGRVEFTDANKRGCKPLDLPGLIVAPPLRQGPARQAGAAAAPRVAGPAPAPARFAGLDLLASAVLLVDAAGAVRYANAAAENLLETSLKLLCRSRLVALFANGAELAALCAQALEHRWADRRQDLALERAGREPLHVHSIVSAAGDGEVLIELRENVQQLKLDREERMLDQSQANKELIRNLA